jgi:WD40 repeat protein
VNISKFDSGRADGARRNSRRNSHLFRRIAIQVVAAASAATAPLWGHAGSTAELSSKVLGSNMNSVAAKVAELPAQDSHTTIFGLDFSPDGSRLAEDSDGNFINIWDWRNRHIGKSIASPKGFNASQVSNGLLYSPDGRLLAACAGRSVGNVFVHIWDTSDWSVANKITDSGVGGCDGISFSPNGQLLARIVDRVGSSGDTVVVHSASTWRPMFGLPIDRFFAPVSVAISPDGRSAAVGGVLSFLRIQQPVSEPKIFIVDLLQHKVIKVVPTEAMGPLAWSPDGKRIAVAGRLVVEIFDAQTGQSLVHEKLGNSGSMNVRFTPDGRYFIESDLNGMGKGLGVKIWDSQRHKLLQEIPGDIGGIAISRDSKYLAVGGTGSTSIWQFK